MKPKRIINYATIIFLLMVISNDNAIAQNPFFKKKLKETKFILSIHPIAETDPLNAKSSEVFTVNDKLYGRIILPFKFKKYFENIGSSLIIKVKKENNSELKLIVERGLSYDIKEESVLDFYFTKKESKSLKRLQGFLDALEVGDTKLKFIVQGGDNVFIVSEEIIFRKSSED
jgi:hypothetical protein